MARRPGAQAAPSNDAAVIDPAAFEEMRRQLVALTKDYNALKASAGGTELLPPEEVPVWEIGPGGFYSSDDTLYPEGMQIEDLLGTLIPNEQMIPLNAAAERRMSAYLKSLPQMGAANNHELFLEAAMMVAHSFDGGNQSPTDAKLEFNRLVLDEVSRLQMKQRGMLPTERVAPVRQARSGPAPIMPNTRIRQGDPGMAGHLPGPAPTRGPSTTRVRAQPVAPANRAAPPMGTVTNHTIGTVGPGARAV